MQKDRSVWEVIRPHVDALVHFAQHPDFDVLIRSPWFIGVSAIVIILCILRKWRFVLVGYLGLIALWGIVHYTVIKGLAGTSAVGWVTIAVLVIAIVAIYVLFIKD